MGKGHKKNRKPQPGSASTQMQPAARHIAPLSSTPASAALARRIVWQLAALLALSAALGFTFNAANPIGVRFGQSKVAAAPLTSPTNFTLTSTASVAVTAPQPIPPPRTAPPTTPQPIQRPTPQPPLPQLRTAAVTHVHTPATNPVPLAVAPPGQTNLNPAPIHWREAKPLAAAGSALLVDVRLAAAYDAGHIPDAISLPESSSVEVFKAFLKQVPTNLTLIVYCSSTSCSQSLRVANRLVTEFHCASVKYMTGGYQEYQQEELARSQPQQ